MLYNLGECLRIAAELLWPLMPTAAEVIVTQLGATLSPDGWQGGALGWGHLPVGSRVGRTRPLFPKIEPTVTG